MNHFLQCLIYFLRILIACICGGVVGYERKNRGKGAGIRTHSIVALASAMIMIVSKYGFLDIDKIAKATDSARLAAQVVSGVGFLGAGMIYFNRHSVKGLTTAAGVWATAGIGLAIGAGMYEIGIFTTLLIVFFQIILHKNQRVLHMPNEEVITVVIDDNNESLEILKQFLNRFEITIDSMKSKRLNDNKLELEFSVNIPADIDYNEVITAFSENKSIYSIDI